jgi:creatinase
MDQPPLIEMQNGERVPGTFSPAEMDRRLVELRSLMSEKSIDAALFTSYHNVNYYSDFLYCSFGRPYGLVVTHDSATSIAANIDGGQPWRRTHGDNVVFTDWQRDNFYEAVKCLVAADATVGIEHDHLSVGPFTVSATWSVPTDRPTS